MAKLDVINQDNQKVGDINLSDDVFNSEVNIPLVHQVIKAQLANRRQGTAKTKTKSEIRGGGKKPFRQKGTGSARQGSSRSSLLVGGGQNFGPQPRSYEQFTNKEMMRGALRSALSDRFKAQRLIIIDQFKLDQAKTKEMADIFKNKLKMTDVLLVTEPDAKLERATKNLAHIKLLRTEGVNVYDIVNYGWLVMTKKAAEVIDSRLGNQA